MLFASLEALSAGKPLAYITGKREFFGLDFYVNPNVLIPRPETELLVSAALTWLGEQDSTIQAADIGTGSGCISVSIAKHHQYIQFTATDISLRALRVAKKNILFHELNNRIHLVQADLLNGIRTQFDCIIANLPYIPSGIYHALAVSHYEPKIALDGGKNGFYFIEHLLRQSRDRIKPEGLILLEMEAGQSEIARRKSQQYFPTASIKILNDLTGKPRLISIINSK